MKTNTWMSCEKRMETSLRIFRGATLPCIRFENFANDVFTLGTRVMQQLLGVAIHGALSSQFATIYCMAREHLWAKSRDFKVPWSKANPDVSLLGTNVPPFRYKDNVCC